MSKNFIVIIIVSGCISAIALFAGRDAPTQKDAPLNEATKQIKDTTSHAPYKKARELTEQKAGVLKETNPGSTNKEFAKPIFDMPNACESEWSNHIYETNSDALAIHKENTYSISEACKKHELEVLKKYNLAFTKNNCMEVFSSSDSTEKQVKSCETAFYYYRVAVISKTTEHVTDYNALSPTVLISKIMAEFFVLDSKPKDLVNAAKILINKEPDVYAARKALATATLMAISRGAKDISWDDFDKSINDCKKFGIQDHELDEATLVKNLMLGQKEEVDGFVDELISKDPPSAFGLYMYSSRLWKQNNKKDALVALKKAIALSPNESRFKNTLKQMNSLTPDTEEKIFQIQISFKPENF